jgi:hypothetical protein
MNTVIIALPYRFCFAIVVACSIMVSGLMVPSHTLATEFADPHWTGKHCTECHVAEKIPELRFDGDVNDLCNRCHGNEPPVCTKVHRQNSVLSDTMQAIIPADWPRADAIMTCLTCHAVHVQMHVNDIAEKENKNFLRGIMPGDLYSFCFNCHEKERFLKTDPHQVSVSNEKQSSCYRCHTGDLASGFDICFETSLKTKSPSLCLGCHSNVSTGHMVHEKLEAEMLEKYEAPLQRLEDEGIELPLADGRVHCATCHNPHPKGIIGRKEAAIGAGEKHFLRISSTYDLCMVCHEEESIEDYIQLFQY